MAPVVISADEYTSDKGILIAELYSHDVALRDICADYPDYLPGMLYVRRWRVMYPAFDALMQEAQGCRAENMAEDILEIADDGTRQSSHNRNRMLAREKVAGWISPAVYGSGSQVKGDDTGRPVHEMKDAELLAIASGDRSAIEGECLRLDSGGGAPPLSGEEGGPVCEVPGPTQPGSNPRDDSVTTIAEIPVAEIPDNKLLPPVSDPQTKNSKSCEGGRLSFVGME